MTGKLKSIWRLVRSLSGDDAYERYLQYYAEQHKAVAEHDCGRLLSKAEFFKQWQDEKWNDIKRCC